MAALNINGYYGCESCAFADRYGNGCKQNLLLPVVLIMSGQKKCKFYKYQEKI